MKNKNRSFLVWITTQTNFFVDLKYCTFHGCGCCFVISYTYRVVAGYNDFYWSVKCVHMLASMSIFTAFNVPRSNAQYTTVYTVSAAIKVFAKTQFVCLLILCT